MKIIMLSAWSPSFNTIGSLRTEKLAKYLSTETDVSVIGGMPSVDQSLPLCKNDMNIGNARVIEIPAKRFSERTQTINRGGTSNSPSKQLMSTKFKRFFGPLIEYLFPVSPGGLIWHKLDLFKDQLEQLIDNCKDNRIVLFSSFGPWFPMKLAFRMKKRYGDRIFWVADFRDPSYRNRDSRLIRRALFKNATRRILSSADLVTCINRKIIDDYQSLFQENAMSICVMDTIQRTSKDTLPASPYLRRNLRDSLFRTQEVFTLVVPLTLNHSHSL